jgi:hypothetical protein
MIHFVIQNYAIASVLLKGPHGIHNEAKHFGPYTSSASGYFMAAKMYELMLILSSVISEKELIFLLFGLVPYFLVNKISY